MLNLVKNDPALIDETVEAIQRIQNLGWTFVFDVGSGMYQACIENPDGSLEVEHAFIDWEEIIAFADFADAK